MMLSGRATMEYWEQFLAETVRLDVPAIEHGSPTSRGWMMTKLIVVQLERGVPVDARELGDFGEPSVVFADPERVWNDLLAERINPFHQVATGQLPLERFSAALLLSKSPLRFYNGPLLYFRVDPLLDLPNAHRYGLAEWEQLKADIARPLPAPAAEDAPAVDGLLIQRVLTFRAFDGRVVQAAELGGSPDGRPILWEPAQRIWNDIVAGALSPTRHLAHLYGDVERMSAFFFYVKDRDHIGYEFGIR
ncbi:MAG: hypothetical protein RMM58_06120 [Chloroflexota bacterium]|nr:hypothetical protein [Dehalococcoidia bacterium]MDW8253437.1 hypothetical protein [Chloroflexota bacterium]